MRYLRQGTQAVIVVGPIKALADYTTAQSVDFDAAGIDVDAYKGGTKSDVTLANSAGDGYWVHVANGNHNLTLSTTHTNTVGRLRITFDATASLSWYADYTVLTAAVYDAMIAGTGLFAADVTNWKGSAAAAMTGDAYEVVNHADHGNAKLVRATTPANTMAVDADGNVTAGNMRGTDDAQTATQAATDKAAIIDAFDGNVTGDTLIDQDTCIDASGNIVVSPLGTALGIATPGSSLVLFPVIAAQTDWTQGKRKTTADGSGNWTLHAGAGTWTLAVSLNGYYDPAEGDSIITRTVVIT